MNLNVLLETKNSKNIFSTWVNRTTDYCDAVNNYQFDFFGILLKLFISIDPKCVRKCPIEVVRFENILLKNLIWIDNVFKIF